MKLSLTAVLIAVCLSCLSSVYARDMNLSDTKYPVMSTYAAEAYLAFDIYTQSKTNSETGEKLYFVSNRYAVLEHYYFDNRTGFNAGMYRLKISRFVVAFGGTTASEDGATKSSAIVDSIGSLYRKEGIYI